MLRSMVPTMVWSPPRSRPSLSWCAIS